MRFDDLIHARLRVGRLVAFVVPVAAVADQVDQKVFAELLAVSEGHAGGGDAGFGIVGVDMDDGDLKAFGQVAGVQA